MPNELLLIASLIFLYTTVVLFYKYLGKTGLYCWTVLATIAANIEVLILVDAFGMEQTLGNILFASTFLVTDILSEVSGRKDANKAVGVGIATSVIFIIISSSWLLYTPNSNDWAMSAIREVFTNTPRTMFAGISVYALVQIFDVWVYHRIWRYTTEKFHNSQRFLWLRNNLSTLISQLLNTVLFTFAAFWGAHDTSTLWNIICSSYLIFIVTSLADTPAVYWARILSKSKIE